MTAPRAKNPILGLHVAKYLDHFLFVAIIQMDWRTYFPGVEGLGNFRLKENQFFRRHGWTFWWSGGTASRIVA
jgi:hypothetical protein